MRLLRRHRRKGGDARPLAATGFPRHRRGGQTCCKGRAERGGAAARRWPSPGQHQRSRRRRPRRQPAHEAGGPFGTGRQPPEPQGQLPTTGVKPASYRGCRPGAKGRPMWPRLRPGAEPGGDATHGPGPAGRQGRHPSVKGAGDGPGSAQRPPAPARRAHRPSRWRRSRGGIGGDRQPRVRQHQHRLPPDRGGIGRTAGPVATRPDQAASVGKPPAMAGQKSTTAGGHVPSSQFRHRLCEVRPRPVKEPLPLTNFGRGWGNRAPAGHRAGFRRSAGGNLPSSTRRCCYVPPQICFTVLVSLPGKTLRLRVGVTTSYRTSPCVASPIFCPTLPSFLCSLVTLPFPNLAGALCRQNP